MSSKKMCSATVQSCQKTSSCPCDGAGELWVDDVVPCEALVVL